jgi:Lon protease-like protein
MATREIGIFALGTALAPGELLPLHVFEDRYKELIGACIESSEPFLLLFEDEQGARDLGCAAQVNEVLERFDDGRMNIVVEGVELLRIVELTDGRSYRTALAEPVADDRSAGEERDAALSMFRTFASAAGLEVPADELESGDLPLSYAIMGRVDFPAADKQRILEMRSERSRLMALVELLTTGLQSLEQIEQIRKRAQTNGKVPHG